MLERGIFTQDSKSNRHLQVIHPQILLLVHAPMHRREIHPPKPDALHITTQHASLCLRILHNPHLGRPQHAPIQHKPLLLRMKHNAIFLVRLRRHKHRLMLIRIELLEPLRRVHALESVLLERRHQYRFRHLEAVVQGYEVVVVGGVVGGGGGGALQFFGRHGGQGAVEVVDAVNEVFGEALQGEVFGGLDFAFCAFLQVAEVGDGAEVFVLAGVSWGGIEDGRGGLM